MTNISINNSLSIRGCVVSLQVSRVDQSLFSANSIMFDQGTNADFIARQLLMLGHANASVEMLRRAVATVGDILGAEHTLRDIDALVKEHFWGQLNLEVEAEFQLVTTGHGIIETEGHHVKLLVKTPAKEVA